MEGIEMWCWTTPHFGRCMCEYKCDTYILYIISKSNEWTTRTLRMVRVTFSLSQMD